MNDTHDFTAYFDRAFSGQPVMGVFRNLPPEAAVARAERAWDAGVRNVEIPVQTPEAMPTLQAVLAAARERDVEVGAGTIVTEEQLKAVKQAGVAYTVSPGLDEVIVRKSMALGLPHLPGIATATEILSARRHGLLWVKAFPASALGASWISAMHGPFPDERFVATGGVKAGDARSFLDAGAHTVAMSDAFDDEAALAAIALLVNG